VELNLDKTGCSSYCFPVLFIMISVLSLRPLRYSGSFINPISALLFKSLLVSTSTICVCSVMTWISLRGTSKLLFEPWPAGFPLTHVVTVRVVRPNERCRSCRSCKPLWRLPASSSLDMLLWVFCFLSIDVTQ
jgi:hypothetical protein